MKNIERIKRKYNFSLLDNPKGISRLPSRAHTRHENITFHWLQSNVREMWSFTAFQPNFRGLFSSLSLSLLRCEFKDVARKTEIVNIERWNDNGKFYDYDFRRRFQYKPTGFVELCSRVDGASFGRREVSNWSNESARSFTFLSKSKHLLCLLEMCRAAWKWETKDRKSPCHIQHPRNCWKGNP